MSKSSSPVISGVLFVGCILALAMLWSMLRGGI